MATTTITSYRPIMNRRRLIALAEYVLGATTLVGAGKRLLERAARLPRYALRNHCRKPCRWRQALEKLGKALRDQQTPPYAVFVRGNSKLPFYAFSSLPLFTCPGAGECASYCYSIRHGWRFSDAFARQIQNTLLLRHDPMEIDRAWWGVPYGAIVRLYVDGDVDSLRTLTLWFDLLDNRPDIQAYGYSKSWEIFLRASRTGVFPGNYVLNLSTGSRYGDESSIAREMEALPITRGWYRSIDVPGWGRGDHSRYADRDYHRAVRQHAPTNRAFSCPGNCGECLPGGGHACGDPRLHGVEIVVGKH